MKRSRSQQTVWNALASVRRRIDIVRATCTQVIASLGDTLSQNQNRPCRSIEVFGDDEKIPQELLTPHASDRVVIRVYEKQDTLTPSPETIREADLSIFVIEPSPLSLNIVHLLVSHRALRLAISADNISFVHWGAQHVPAHIGDLCSTEEVNDLMQLFQRRFDLTISNTNRIFAQLNWLATTLGPLLDNRHSNIDLAVDGVNFQLRMLLKIRVENALGKFFESFNSIEGFDVIVILQDPETYLVYCIARLDRHTDSQKALVIVNENRRGVAQKLRPTKLAG